MRTSEVTIFLDNISREYSFVQISDAHAVIPCEDDSEAYKKEYERSIKQWTVTDKKPYEELLSITKYVDENNFDGLFVAGDIIDYVHEPVLNWLRDIKDNMKTPMFLTFGNHEGSSYVDKNPGRSAYQKYEGLISGSPDFWTAEFPDFLLVGLDNSDHNIEKSQLLRLREVLEGKKPVILLIHIPIYSEDIIDTVDGHWGKGHAGYFLFGNENDLKNENNRKFLEIVRENGVNIAAILAGHIHTPYVGKLSNDVPMIVSDAAYTGNITVLKIKPKRAS